MGEQLYLPAPSYRCAPAGGGRWAEVEPRKPIVPSDDEVAANPRARSAKLRIFQVDDAP